MPEPDEPDKPDEPDVDRRGQYCRHWIQRSMIKLSSFWRTSLCEIDFALWIRTFWVFGVYKDNSTWYQLFSEIYSIIYFSIFDPFPLPLSIFLFFLSMFSRYAHLLAVHMPWWFGLLWWLEAGQCTTSPQRHHSLLCPLQQNHQDQQVWLCFHEYVSINVKENVMH